jgi:hypothetical protein
MVGREWHIKARDLEALIAGSRVVSRSPQDGGEA